MAVINPVGPNLRIDTANTVSVATTQQTQYLRVVVGTSTHAHVAIGSAPTAAATDFVAVRDVPEIISIGKPVSQRLVGVTTGTTTTFRFPDGEGSQLHKGQIAILEDTNTADPYWKTAIGICTVLSINDRANFPNGAYPHNVEIVGTGDSSLIQTSVSDGTRLVQAFQVAALAGSDALEGFVNCQQVQITGG